MRSIVVSIGAVILIGLLGAFSCTRISSLNPASPYEADTIDPDLLGGWHAVPHYDGAFLDFDFVPKYELAQFIYLPGVNGAEAIVGHQRPERFDWAVAKASTLVAGKDRFLSFKPIVQDPKLKGWSNQIILRYRVRAPGVIDVWYLPSRDSEHISETDDDNALMRSQLELADILKTQQGKAAFSEYLGTFIRRDDVSPVPKMPELEHKGETP